MKTILAYVATIPMFFAFVVEAKEKVTTPKSHAIWNMLARDASRNITNLRPLANRGDPDAKCKIVMETAFADHATPSRRNKLREKKNGRFFYKIILPTKSGDLVIRYVYNNEGERIITQITSKPESMYIEFFAKPHVAFVAPDYDNGCQFTFSFSDPSDRSASNASDFGFK